MTNEITKNTYCFDLNLHEYAALLKVSKYEES